MKPILSLRITTFAIVGGILLFLLTLAAWHAREALGGSGALLLVGLAGGLLLAIFGLLLLEHRARERALAASREAQKLVERAQADVARRAGDLDRLAQFGEQLQGCRSVDEIGEALALAMQGLLPQFDGALYVQAAGRNVLSRQVMWGKPQPPPEEMFGLDDCWALRRGALYPPPGRAPACRHLADAVPVERTLCAPLRAQGETLGVLHVIAPTVTSAAERRLVQTLADQLALTICNQRLRDTLRIQQVRDPLTGLLNRRHLDETLLREGLKARRRNRPFALLMIDLDHFKRFTERHGHDVGDIALVQIAEQVQQTIGVDDIAFRYGGEEFVVLMPDTDVAAAVEMAETVRRAVRAAHIDFHGRRLDVITVSIGVAAFPAHGSEPAQCLRAADKALNTAKEGGRDRIETAEPVNGDPAA